MVLTSSLIVGAISLFLCWIWQRRRYLRYFAKKGIPGPKPSLFLGNMKDVQKKGFFQTIEDWSKEYGKTFGYYEGATPVLCTSDLNLIQHVFIKEFSKFHSRKSSGLTDPDGRRVDIAMARGYKWKKLRSVASPAFSAMRMKQMSPMINNVVDRLIDLLQKKADTGEGFDLHKTYQRLTMDVIGCCAFGIEVNSLEDDDDLFLRKFNEFFTNLENRIGIVKAIILINLLSPYLSSWVSKLNLGSPLSDEWFDSITKNIIDQRKSEKIEHKRTDFIQLMLNAEAHEDVNIHDLEVVLGKEDDYNYDVINKIELKNKRNSCVYTEEIQASSFIFLLAGFETSSTTLGLLAYHLAASPDVQEKIQQEIDDHFPDECMPDYGSVQKLEYLNMAIQEVLRLYPIGMVGVQRLCFASSQYGDMSIQPGTVVLANMAAIHMDPEHWGPEDPKLFVPERFTKERVANRQNLAWMPFGVGPRNCVGMRFALMEVKIAAARVLKHFRILSCDQTKVPLPLRKNIIRAPSEGIYVKLEEREKTC